MWKKVISPLLILTIMSACTGCTIGIKENKTLVMVSPRPIPEVSKGAPVIATNSPLPLVILNKPDMTFEKDVAGYVVVDPWFYDLLIKTYNNSEKKQ